MREYCQVECTTCDRIGLIEVRIIKQKTQRGVKKLWTIQGIRIYVYVVMTFFKKKKLTNYKSLMHLAIKTASWKANVYRHTIRRFSYDNWEIDTIISTEVP